MTVSVHPVQKPFTVAVVGGGIGGLAFAIGLLHRGIAVQVYESARAFTEIGAGIAIGPNGVRCLDLISPALKTAFDSLVTKNMGENEEATWINFRCGMGEPKLVAKVHTINSGKTGLGGVHRAQILEEMVNLIPENVAHFGKRLVHLHPRPANTIRLEFEDGTMAEADAVVGCDGVRSKVRRILSGQKSDIVDVDFTHTVAYRALIPMDKAKPALGDEFTDNAQLYIGPGKCLLTYPIEHGKSLNAVALCKEDGRWEHSKWEVPRTQQELKEHYQGWVDPVQKTIEVSDFQRKQSRG